ncbi:MAG: putative transporter permease protein [Thermomicrobiales bacterium]|jgi:multiple sugar transport system permease protein|nr:putative transporter permease protein [Thermomicrobiales bacterium]MCD6058178.1 putative transporter permease protein [Thermomicrobiales bacterium]MDF2757573.1 putative transporter permease protein [Thermomicrobiales bacterium]MDF3015454.1 putative transporter permease protein [Thermomicrobiales bacterium]
MRKALILVAVLTATLIALFPLYWAIVTSLRPRDADLGDLWLPGVTFQPTLAAWERLLALPGLLDSLGNSIAISVGAATLAITLAAPAAYAIGRLRFPRGWAPAMLLAFLLLRLLPPVIYLPSYLLLLRRLGQVDTVTGLVIVNATFNLPLAAIILTGAFREIPRELEEAAWVDGVGRWGSFVRICLPLVAPAIAASWLLCLAFIWNEWMYASALGYTEARSFPVLIQATGSGGGVNFGAATTRALAATAVPVLAALLAQRYIVRALSLGAVKG